MAIAKDKMQNGARGGYFPFRFVVDFLEYLHEHRDRINIVTYNDLPWGDDYDYANTYPDECAAWWRKLNKGDLDSSKIYLLIQHDVDRLPERTFDFLKEEERLGIPSNVMIFNKRINRRHLQETGELLYTDYDIDSDYLRHLQDDFNFVIGYHSNAFEQAKFDIERAEHIFENDIRELREKYDVRFFTPHGGAKSHDGFTNNCLPVPVALERSIRWVDNRYKVRFDGNYSDGGINSLSRDPKKRDLRDFVRTWKPGNRYRVLLHPQYYHSPCGVSPRLSGVKWYDELIEFCNGGGSGSTWRNV